MEELKKHLFWIILGVIVLGGCIAYFVMVPDVEEARKNALAKTAALEAAAKQAPKPNGLLTSKHAAAAEAYTKKLDTDKDTLVGAITKWPDLSEKTLNARYGEAPPAASAIQFDTWMADQRKRLAKKLTDASVAPPKDFDKILLSDFNIDPDPKNTDVRRHRLYQLQVLNVMEETVDALCAKVGTVTTTGFENDVNKPEPQNSVPGGALALVSLTLRLPDETSKIDEKAYLAALQKTGYKPEANAKDAGYKGAELPISVWSVDIEFLSPVQAIPAVMKKLEASERYFGVVTKGDFERLPPIFPGASTDTKVQEMFAKAAYDPMHNTHYGEGPVKAFVTLELFEYDKVKAEKAAAAAKAPPPAPKK